MIRSPKLLKAAPAVFAFMPGAVLSVTNDRINISNENFVQEMPCSFTLKADIGEIDCGSFSRIPVKTNEWDEEKEARFDTLATKHALDETSAGEEFELRQLQSLRLQELAPRSYEEVKREFEIEKATNNAIQAIDTLIRSFSSGWPA